MRGDKNIRKSTKYHGQTQVILHFEIFISPWGRLLNLLLIAYAEYIPIRYVVYVAWVETRPQGINLSSNNLMPKQ